MTDLGRPVQVLLVEDNPGDVNLTRIAMRDLRIANELHVVGDGESALAFLRQAGPYGDAPRPSLVLLDLNLPGMRGEQVLATMKEDPALRRIPVIVLTTSSDEADVLRSYDLHANSFVTKPLDFDEFMQALKAIEGFWLTIVQLPEEG